MKVTDLRRTDQRTNVLANPYWISSAVVSGADVEANGGSGATITATTIAGVSSTADSFTDSDSGFTAAGFTIATDPIAVSGFTGAGAAISANNRLLTLTGVAAGTLDIAETGVISDAAGESVTIWTPKANVLFSFPDAGKRYIIEECQLQLIEAFTANTQIYVGLGTIATDAITTGGTILNTDIDAYFTNTDVTIATPAYYAPTGTAWYTAAGLCGSTSPRIITGAASTVPVIYAAVVNCTNGAPAAITAGQFRLHLQISVVPGK